MKQEELINLDNALKVVETEHFSKESKIDLNNALFYVVSKNRRIIAPVVKAFEDLKLDVSKQFEKTFDLDKAKYSSDKDYAGTADKAYQDFLQEEDNLNVLKSFLEEESSLSLHKIEEEKAFEGTIIPLDLFNIVFKDLIQE